MQLFVAVPLVTTSYRASWNIVIILQNIFYMFQEYFNL